MILVLSNNKEEVNTIVAGLGYQKGFANTARALG